MTAPDWCIPSGIISPPSLFVALLGLHMVVVHYILAGSAYLAFGRFMGPRRCGICGWQALLLESLPRATVAAAVTGAGPLFVLSVCSDRQLSLGPLQLPPRWPGMLAVLIACYGLVVLQGTAWMTRRAWFWRIPLTWAVFCGFAFLAYGWTEHHLLVHEPTARPGWLPRLGISFFGSFVTVSVALAWQGHARGMDLVQPPPGSAAVMGLSAVRRLAVTAASGILGTIACTAAAATPVADSSHVDPVSAAWFTAAAAGLAIQLFAWGFAAIHDRLPRQLLLTATGGWILSITAAMVLREIL